MVTVLGENGYLGSVVKRRWAELGIEGPYVVNCIRPDDILLSWKLGEQGHLLQPSTDAIAEDTDYARTKRIIEKAPGAVVLRSGIVDISRQPAVAYRNWWCNPLTPLEWADWAARVRDEPGLHEAGREILSRFEVTQAVAEVFDRPQPVPATGPECDRIMFGGDRAWPDLRKALRDYLEWLRRGAEMERMGSGHS